MTPTNSQPAAAAYAARVDAVLEQRSRLRGAQPPGDLFDGLPPNHPLLGSQPHAPLAPNVAAIAEYIGPESVLVDVGGGAGRISLPLALRCARVINVEPSGGMAAAFKRNAQTAGISNVDVVNADWEAAEPPEGTVALVNHVTYMTRDIVTFIEKLEISGRERVIITVGSKPPPSRNRVLYELIHGEPEQIVPSHVELVNVLWEMGRLPDVRVLPGSGAPLPPPTPTREAAIASGLAIFQAAQWTFWPMTPEVTARAHALMEERFEQLFTHGENGYSPGWIVSGPEVLITWRPEIDRL
jgi:hypothetical protein